jgi:hypothetical protein
LNARSSSNVDVLPIDKQSLPYQCYRFSADTQVAIGRLCLFANTIQDSQVEVAFEASATHLNKEKECNLFPAALRSKHNSSQGSGSATLNRQSSALRHNLPSRRSLFDMSTSGGDVDIFVPGRLCILGESRRPVSTPEVFSCVSHPSVFAVLHPQASTPTGRRNTAALTATSQTVRDGERMMQAALERR